MFDYSLTPGREIKTRYPAEEFHPLISIITAVYNRVTYLEPAIRSVLNQTFPWFEWIIVDDGSADPEVVAYLDRLPEKDSRIRIVHQKNGGVARARNNGVAHARADIILPLDDDDLIAPTYLDELYWMLQKNPDAGWAYAALRDFEEKELLWNPPFSSKVERTENLAIIASAIRKSAFEEVGGYCTEQDNIHEDWLFYLNMLSLGYYPAQGNNTGFWYRVRSGTRISQPKDMGPITKAAANVPDGLDGIHYPVLQPETFCSPVRSTFPLHVANPDGKERLLVIVPWCVMGGADKFNLDLVRLLNPEKYEITIVTMKPSENNWLQEFEKYAAEIFVLPGFARPEEYPEFISYLIDSRGIDLLLTTNSDTGLALIPWLRAQYPSLPMLDYEHNFDLTWRNGGHSRTAATIHQMLDGICVCSENCRQTLIDRLDCPPEVIKTVYIGVDAQKFDPAAVKEGRLRKEEGFGDRPLVLFPCRLDPIKRPILMLRIAHQLKQRVPDVAFVVIGDGEERERMEKEIARLHLEETVYLLGAQKDMPRFYRDADVTLVCSLLEGLSLTAYESCAMGTPVVTSDVGGQKELVDDTVGCILPMMQDASKDMFNYDYSDEEIEQYVSAMEKLLTDSECLARKGRLSRERILNGFDLKCMISCMEAEFERAAETAKRKQAIYEQFRPFAQQAGELFVNHCEFFKLTHAYMRDTAWYHDQIPLMETEMTNMRATIEELTKWNREQEKAGAWSAGQIDAMTQEQKALLKQIDDLQAWIQEQEKSAAWSAGQVEAMSQEQKALLKQIGDLQAWIQEQEKSAAWNAGQIDAMSQERKRLLDRIAELEAWCGEQDRAKTYLEGREKELLARIAELEANNG